MPRCATRGRGLLRCGTCLFLAHQHKACRRLENLAEKFPLNYQIIIKLLNNYSIKLLLYIIIVKRMRLGWYNVIDTMLIGGLSITVHQRLVSLLSFLCRQTSKTANGSTSRLEGTRTAMASLTFSRQGADPQHFPLKNPRKITHSFELFAY